MDTQSSGLTLGIWDGHDAGAALIDNERIIAAVNEERLSRRKLEIGFPYLSIAEVLRIGGVTPSEIRQVACSTTDFSKTLTRVFPSLKESYYRLRRRKSMPGAFYGIKKQLKYLLTELPGSALTEKTSRFLLRRELSRLGFNSCDVQLVDHHLAHAAGAACCSGFREGLVVTLDGIGDGSSGSFWTWENGQLRNISRIPGSVSLGIFFEHVTNLLNMRELEDEGKVMALANYACPVPDEDNPMLSWFRVDGLSLKSDLSCSQLYRELSKVLWRFPGEQFAFMAQRTLEKAVASLVREALTRTGHTNVAYAGGVASNVKVNMLLNEMKEIQNLFMFPHMGDGGLALGAALACNGQRGGLKSYSLEDAFLGPSYSREEILAELGRHVELEYSISSDPVSDAANKILSGQTIMWMNGRMEYGPRALGHRSILARADSSDVKDELNLSLKRRVWYQPFCPSMLESTAHKILEGYRGERNPFMTCAYRVKKEMRSHVQGVINIDGSCRPQIIPDDDTSRLAEMLRQVSKSTGYGVVLNTSFNIHGEPLVCSVKDCIRTFAGSNAPYLFLEDVLVSKRRN